MLAGGKLGGLKLLDIAASNQKTETDPLFNNVVLLLPFDGANNSTIFTEQKGKTVTPFGDIHTGGNDPGQDFHIGMQGTGANPFFGYTDETRITKAVREILLPAEPFLNK
jgi:hypothetical protein